MVMTRESAAVMASWRVANEDAMMMLSCRRRFFEMLSLASIRDRIKWAVHGFYRHLLTAIGGIHFLLAIFADGHVFVPKGLQPGNVRHCYKVNVLR